MLFHTVVGLPFSLKTWKKEMKTEIQPWEKEAFLRVETILYLVLL